VIATVVIIRNLFILHIAEPLIEDQN
jgi:hypothetical protein